MIKWTKRVLYLLITGVLIILIFIYLKITFIGKAINEPILEPYFLKSTNEKNIQLTFLGTSCFIVGYQGKEFVSDPFFSNPSVPSTFTGNMQLLPINKFIKDSLCRNVEMMTVSHGHYDHCLDFEQFLKPTTTFVADTSVVWQLFPLLKNNKNIVSLNFIPHTKWIYSVDSTFRVFPILSKHGPHIANIVFFNGKYTTPQKQLPTNLLDWKLGSGNYSFLLDVMNRDSIVFRMAFLYGNIEQNEIEKIKAIYAQQKCDIQTSVFWKKTQNESQLKVAKDITHADIILLNHWNNFFRSNDKSLQSFKSSEIDKELEILNKENIPARIMLPYTTVNL